jgi:predicted DNA-binding transcriptional regulator YafY
MRVLRKDYAVHIQHEGQDMNTTPVKIDYTNHRGERSIRTILPEQIEWAKTEWHPETQWLLLAWDCDKEAEREFAMKDIHSWTPS